MERKPELETPLVCFIPVPPLQGKKPRKEQQGRRACSVMSEEEVDFRNPYPEVRIGRAENQRRKRVNSRTQKWQKT